jgi:hypothetical protein
MSLATLSFTLPDESHEFKAAANVGNLLSAVQDLEAELRRRDKYGKPAEKRLTAEQARRMLHQALNDHGAGWALE